MKHIKTLEPGNGYWLCETDGGTIGRVANDDIARDIIIACNEHDRLVAERDALLEAAKALVRWSESDDDEYVDELIQVTRAARAAISLVRRDGEE